LHLNIQLFQQLFFRNKVKMMIVLSLTTYTKQYYFLIKMFKIATLLYIHIMVYIHYFLPFHLTIYLKQFLQKNTNLPVILLAYIFQLTKILISEELPIFIMFNGII